MAGALRGTARRRWTPGPRAPGPSGSGPCRRYRDDATAGRCLGTRTAGFQRLLRLVRRLRRGRVRDHQRIALVYLLTEARRDVLRHAELHQPTDDPVYPRRP